MTKVHDAIVIGLGAMGSAAFYQLAKAGANVLGIEQFEPLHTLGSSHGDTRITRLAIGEGDIYVPLALRSHEIWKELEAATGEKLLIQNGCLIISSDEVTMNNHVENLFENTLRVANKFNIEHEILNANDIRQRFPQFKVADSERGYLEKAGGYVIPEVCKQVQIQEGVRLGGLVHTNEKVLSYKDQGGLVEVQTNVATYATKKLVLTAGAWMPELLEQKYSSALAVRRQVLYWFKLAKPVERYTPEHQPVFVWELQGEREAIYGFPAVDGQEGGFKIATEQHKTTTSPESIDRVVTDAEIAHMYTTLVEPSIDGLAPQCVKTATCMYTVTPDSGFIIDFHPEMKNVIIASPCSGHGFKHSAAIGQVLAELATQGKTSFDISKFSISRFN